MKIKLYVAVVTLVLLPAPAAAMASFSEPATTLRAGNSYGCWQRAAAGDFPFTGPPARDPGRVALCH
uniref:hypothetical protein n=1 Tax=Paractinoplanes polyasparticus TaxID=2856853 RepID=UPI001C8570B7|nr:hypothetical protein [Actinoplanes polyasparticus]